MSCLLLPSEPLTITKLTGNVEAFLNIFEEGSLNLMFRPLGRSEEAVFFSIDPDEEADDDEAEVWIEENEEDLVVGCLSCEELRTMPLPRATNDEVVLAELPLVLLLPLLLLDKPREESISASNRSENE